MIVKLICAGKNDLSSTYKYDDKEFIIAVDGGIKYVKERKLIANIAIGDFDSSRIDDYSLFYKEMLMFPKKKNESDLELAIKYVIDNLDFDRIEIYNASGKRLDHFISSIRLLVKYCNYPIFFIDKENKIFIVNKEAVINKNEYKYISFFSCHDNTIIDLKGFKYNLDSYCLNYDDSLCLSNEIKEQGIVKVSNKVITFFSHKKTH